MSRYSVDCHFVKIAYTLFERVVLINVNIKRIYGYTT